MWKSPALPCLQTEAELHVWNYSTGDHYFLEGSSVFITTLLSYQSVSNKCRKPGWSGWIRITLPAEELAAVWCCQTLSEGDLGQRPLCTPSTCAREARSNPVLLWALCRCPFIHMTCSQMNKCIYLRESSTEQGSRSGFYPGLHHWPARSQVTSVTLAPWL